MFPLEFRSLSARARMDENACARTRTHVHGRERMRVDEDTCAQTEMHVRGRERMHIRTRGFVRSAVILSFGDFVTVERESNINRLSITGGSTIQQAPCMTMNLKMIWEACDYPYCFTNLTLFVPDSLCSCLSQVLRLQDSLRLCREHKTSAAARLPLFVPSTASLLKLVLRTAVLLSLCCMPLSSFPLTRQSNHRLRSAVIWHRNFLRWARQLPP
jgi:hypothetical protein